jgi:hypothetical protein
MNQNNSREEHNEKLLDIARQWLDCTSETNKHMVALLIENKVHQELQKARQDGYNAGLADGTGKPLLAIEQELQKARVDD